MLTGTIRSVLIALYLILVKLTGRTKWQAKLQESNGTLNGMGGNGGGGGGATAMGLNGQPPEPSELPVDIENETTQVHIL